MISARFVYRFIFNSQKNRNSRAEHALKNDMTEPLLSAKGDILILDLAEERIPKAKITFQNQTVMFANHPFFEPVYKMFGTGSYRETTLTEFRFNALSWEVVQTNLRQCYQLLPNAKQIRLPEELYTIWFHRWGLNPLHYTSETYEYLANCINFLTGVSNRDTCEALYQELKFKNALLSKILNL